MKKYTFTAFLIFSIAVSVYASPEPDSDGDGLSDFQEIHKYFTDPDKRDTDGDGIPDGDWQERREYTYTIRIVVKVMRPCNTAVVNDNYQDARVLSETKDYVELEVVHYPFNTNAETIRGKADWKEQPEGVKHYLEPGITTNWDEKLRKDIIVALEADNIHLEKLTDKEAVERVSSWLMRRARYLDKAFTTYYVYYPDGHPKIYPGLESAFELEFGRDKANYNWTIDGHFDHELLGKGMFYNKTHGSCTSFAVYLTTVLRAIGIPTRMVLAIPIADSSDPNQIQLVKKNISNNKVRQTLLDALKDLKGFTAHTFNEVYVGRRWCRLSYSKLGQNIYGEGAMGLLTHINTFADLSDANLAATWGLRYGKGKRDPIFRYSNPYATTDVTDRLGLHCNINQMNIEQKGARMSQE